ncbi:MAG: hypothetical protein II207_01175, partial [Clostridia bacterium]|nr:hypothetical protein [Clostridia bacterium]
MRIKCKHLPCSATIRILVGLFHWLEQPLIKQRDGRFFLKYQSQTDLTSERITVGVGMAVDYNLIILQDLLQNFSVHQS